MISMRAVAAASFALLLAVACGGAQPSGAARPNRSGGRCPPMSEPSVAACPTQAVPPGDGVGEQCKSDADCKSPSGTDGRCVKNPMFGEVAPRPVHNLLAEPPPPPSRSLCVFDSCHSDSDCGAKSKCVCGSGRGIDRNQCVPLDRCRADGDCGAGNICLCGSAAKYNYCVEGDCHEDADCDDGFKCESNHCHSKKDTCRTSADCPPVAEGPRTCRWGREARRWDCHIVPPIPPG